MSKNQVNFQGKGSVSVQVRNLNDAHAFCDCQRLPYIFPLGFINLIIKANDNHKEKQISCEQE